MQNVQSDNGKKKALVIAISDYENLSEDKQLPFCRNDGKVIYDTLVKCGYEITEPYVLIGKVDGLTIRKRINEFFIRNANSTDTLVFYFSGHGFPDGYGTHFLVSSDMDVDVPNESGFAFSELSQIIEKSKAARKITILDCCYSGAAEAKGSTDDAANSGRETMDKVFDEGDGKCVLASSLSDQESFKMQNEDFSAFTFYVIKGLRSEEGEAVNELGYVTPDTLGNYVYQRLMSLPHVKQKPIRKTSQSGEIILVEYPNYRKEKQELEEKTRSWFAEGLEFLSKNDYDKALVNLDKVVQAEPENASAWSARGFTFLGLKNYNKATQCFERSLDIQPKNELTIRGKSFSRHASWVLKNL